MTLSPNTDSRKNQICERLQLARKLAGYSTAKEFSEIFDLKVSTYHMHESGLRNMALDIMEQYANLLKINTDWMLTGQGPMLAEKVRKVPIISWNDLKDLNSKKSLSSSEWTVSDLDLQAGSFALRVEDDAMDPRYPEGSIIIVDIGREPQNKDFAILYSSNEEVFLFKQLVLVNGLWYAKSVNSSYKAILLKSVPKTIGKVVQAKLNC